MTTKKIQFEDMGLQDVWLSNGYEVDDDPDYGETVGYEELRALTHQVCVALSLRKGRLRGTEFRYIRSALELPRKEVGRLFDRTELTILNWESRNKVPLEASILLKQICLKRFGKEGWETLPLEQAGMADLPTLKIVMSFDSTTRQWSSNLHPVPQRAPVVFVRQPAFNSTVQTKLSGLPFPFSMEYPFLAVDAPPPSPDDSIEAFLQRQEMRSSLSGPAWTKRP